MIGGGGDRGDVIGRECFYHSAKHFKNSLSTSLRSSFLVFAHSLFSITLDQRVHLHLTSSHLFALLISLVSPQSQTGNSPSLCFCAMELSTYPFCFVSLFVLQKSDIYNMDLVTGNFHWFLSCKCLWIRRNFVLLLRTYNQLHFIPLFILTSSFHVF